MMEQSDVVLLRLRRRFLLRGALLSGLLTAGGILIGVLDNHWLGYSLAAVFGLGTLVWAGRLLTPPEVLLALPASHFRVIASNELEIQHSLREPHPAEKTTLRITELADSMSGVWDRELDTIPRMTTRRWMTVVAAVARGVAISLAITVWVCQTDETRVIGFIYVASCYSIPILIACIPTLIAVAMQFLIVRQAISSKS